MRAGAEVLDPELVFESQALPDADERVVAHGPEELKTWMRGFITQWVDYRLIGDEFRDAGNKVFAAGRQTARGRQSGAEVEQPLWSVWTFRADRVVGLQFTSHREEALEAAGYGIRPCCRAWDCDYAMCPGKPKPLNTTTMKVEPAEETVGGVARSAPPAASANQPPAIGKQSAVGDGDVADPAGANADQHAAPRAGTEEAASEAGAEPGRPSAGDARFVPSNAAVPPWPRALV